MEFEEIIKELEELSNPEDIEGMARFGINNHEKIWCENSGIKTYS